jgi:hypothetical protein
VTIHNVHLKLEQDIWELARQAAEADRRSLTNWINVTIERAVLTQARDGEADLDGR